MASNCLFLLRALSASCLTVLLPRGSTRVRLSLGVSPFHNSERRSTAAEVCAVASPAPLLTLAVVPVLVFDALAPVALLLAPAVAVPHEAEALASLEVTAASASDELAALAVSLALSDAADPDRN